MLITQLGPGDLKINLSVDAPTAISVLRSPQEDMTVAVAENLTQKEMPGRLAEFLKVARSNSIIRRYEFGSLSGLLRPPVQLLSSFSTLLILFPSDMHFFQQAITGFKVLFDG